MSAGQSLISEARFRTHASGQKWHHQAHDLLKAAHRVDGQIQVLKASKASTVINARGLERRGARIETIEGGHLAPMEQPQAVSDWLRQAADRAGV